MKQIIISIFYVTLIVFVNSDAFACSCNSIEDKEESFKTNFEEADLIFLGQVNNKNLVQIVHLYKGSMQNALLTIVKESSCDILPPANDFWLFYGKYTSDATKITISQCSLSRSFSNPEQNAGKIPPPPPKPGESYSDVELRNQKELYRLEANVDLLNEIEWLRAMKKNGKENLSILSNDLESNKNQSLVYIALGLSILSIMLVLFNKR